VDEEQLMELALDAGAEDIDSEDDGSMSVITAPEGFASMVEALNKAGLEAEHADVSMVPSTTNACDHETAEQVIRLLEALEDLDDVQDVHSNGDFPDSVMADV
jgi:transcriptional/translational regulatory protein YebC/TACO1